MNYYNEKDIKKTYEFLNHENYSEIRLIDPHKRYPPKVIFIKNYKELEEVAIQYAGEYNINIGIHERKGKGTKSENVIAIKTIIVDIDPERPPNTTSTEAQLQEAIEKANKIQEWLKKKKIESYKAISGNGCHLWIPTPTFEVNNENREKSKEFLRIFYKYLQHHFNNSEKVKIDNIGDLPRLIKVIGTISTKGEKENWRLSKWIDEPKRVKNEAIINLFEEIGKWNKQQEKQVNRIKEIGNLKLKKIDLILQYDKQFQKLLKKERNFKSRSEEEMAVVIRLVAYGLTFEEVNEAMITLNFEKWKEAHEKYREYTYNKAVENKGMVTIKKPLESYLKLKVKEVIMYQSGEESMTKIIIGETKIALNINDLTNANKFRALYFADSGEMLPPIPVEMWSQILTYWTKNFGKFKDIDRDTEEEIMKEKIIEEIESFIVVEDKEEALNYGRMLEEEKEYLIIGKSIEEVIKRFKFNIKIQRVVYLLEDYIAGKSKPKRINNKLYRFWRFKKEKLKVNDKEEEVML